MDKGDILLVRIKNAYLNETDIGIELLDDVLQVFECLVEKYVIDITR